MIRNAVRGGLACLVMLAAVAAGTRAADAPTPAQLIDAAIAAHGGRDAIAALPSLEMKGSFETLSGRSAGRRADGLLRERADGAYRREVTFDLRGRKVTAIEFYDLTVVKRRFGSSWDDLPTNEAREAAAHRLPWLLAIDAATAKLEGEATEADVACWKLSVPDGSGRATLMLAKDGGRVVAIERPGTSADGMGVKKQVQVKTIWRDVRRVGALALPFDVESAEDGVPDSRIRWDSVVVLKDFDAEWIRLPDPTRRFIPSEELSF